MAEHPVVRRVPWQLPVLGAAAILATHLAFWQGGVYGAVPHVDAPLHFGGGAVATLAVLAAAPVLRCAGSRLELALMMFFAATTVAVLWEVLEYFLDLLLATGFQNSLADTIRDLILGMLGAAAVIIWNLTGRAGGEAS